MASIRISGPPEAEPAAEPWPADEHTIRADEMFARRLDTEFATGVRTLLHDPTTGLSSLEGEAALEAIAGVYPALEELRQRTLGEAIGPRQRALVEPAIDARLDWAAGTIGRLAERATVQVDDQSVAERLAGLGQDAAASWDDPANLRTLGRAAVSELRWQGERRGWDQAETDVHTRAGLSDLYAGAVEAAIGKDVDGAASLLAHAREVIDPARLATIDHRLHRAREDGFLREVDAALQALPLDPAAPPALDPFSARIAELTPEDATDGVRGRLGELASHAQRRAERLWNRRQAEAGVAALDWLKQNPDASPLFLPSETREWLASDQFDGLKTLEQRGRLFTDPDLYWRLDRLSIYEPAAFATLDLDRHRLSLDDKDHEHFAGRQKAIADGTTDPAFARYDWVHRGIDHALGAAGIDTDSPAAAKARVDARDHLASFEAIEGRPPLGADLDEIVRRTVEATTENLPAGSDNSIPGQQDPSGEEATRPLAPNEPQGTRFDDGTRIVEREGVETERGRVDVTEAYDERDRIVSADAVFVDGHRVESRWSYPGEGHWSQVDTVRDPVGNVVGTVTTVFDGERVTRTTEPVDGPPQTEAWDRDGPVATVQNVVAPALAVPFLLDLTAAAIGAVIVGKAVGDTIDRSGAGTFGGSEMARPPDRKPGKGHNNPPGPVEDDKPPPSGPPVPPFPPGQRPSWRQSERDDAREREPDFTPQVSFKDGKEVGHGTVGSVRPDGVSADRRSASFEVKNYDINANADGLVSTVSRQVLERARHLPADMQQNINIDARGQNVSAAQLDGIRKRIVNSSNGMLKNEHVTFMEP